MHTWNGIQVVQGVGGVGWCIQNCEVGVQIAIAVSGKLQGSWSGAQ